MPVDNAAQLNHEWTALQSDFANFHTARDLTGTWKAIEHATFPPDIHPDLKKYAQGLQYMSGMLQDDFRILKILHSANPTMLDAQVRGSTQTARNLERDFKLTWASWWDNDLNDGRWLDSWVYEGQIGSGLTVPWLRWKQCDNGDGTSGCPVYVEETIVDALQWQGSFRNPSAAWCKYTTSMLDCDVKNGKGERPYYERDGAIGWTSEMLPPESYVSNAGKTVEIIVRDAEDYLAMCPLEGCHHRQRRITVYICKSDGKVDDYEEVESYDSPFEKCSFIIVGGDVRKTERDPHRILRPSAWILIDICLQYNFLFNSLLATFAREMSDDRMVINAGATNPETLQALAGDEDSGQTGTVTRPEMGSGDIAILPGQVQSLPKPSTVEMMALLDKLEKQYAMRRPNPALTGQMALSEVTGTGAVLQTQGAGQMLSEDLANWDTAHKRMFYETMHGIRFTAHFEPDDEQTRYVATVSGRENVKGGSGGLRAGDEVWLDAKKCETKVNFTAETSKDTPQDRRDREERARTAEANGIFVPRQTYEAYGIQDIQAHEEELERTRIRKQLQPWADRRIAARLMAKSAAVTGVDHGEEQGIASMPLPDEEQGGTQSVNTLQANNSRLHTPPVTLAPTGTPTGGSSGLG